MKYRVFNKYQLILLKGNRVIFFLMSMRILLIFNFKYKNKNKDREDGRERGDSSKDR